jgi:hypothetical protein
VGPEQFVPRGASPDRYIQAEAAVRRVLAERLSVPTEEVLVSWDAFSDWNWRVSASWTPTWSVGPLVGNRT